MRQHQVRRGGGLRPAAGDRAVRGRHGRGGGGLAAGIGRPRRGGRALRRLRVLRQASEDVVQVGGAAADERGGPALRPPLPVWIWPHDEASESSAVEANSTRVYDR